MESLSVSKSNAIREAAGQALPVVFGYLPIGFAFGILARSSGMPGILAVLMSLLVYAGSGQLISVGLFAAGASPWSIVITTAVVNLRHLLFSAALSPHLRRWKPLQLAAFAFELTDETFALHSTRFAQSPALPLDTFIINAVSQFAWILGTFLGVAAGDVVRDVKPFGLDYALAAMFTALLVFQIKDRRLLAIAILGGALSTGLLMAGVSQWNVIIATVVAATAGLGLEAWTQKSSS